MANISQMPFWKDLLENFLIFIQISLRLVPIGFNWQWDSIGLGNGLVQNRQQAINWTNGVLVDWFNMSSQLLSHNKLRIET